MIIIFTFFPEWAESLTDMGKGKHFIGDFLPPEELEKFMETFKALKASFSLTFTLCIFINPTYGASVGVKVSQKCSFKGWKPCWVHLPNL